jgi:hypothetical protein
MRRMVAVLRQQSCHRECQPRHPIMLLLTPQLVRMLGAVGLATCLEHPQQWVLHRLTCCIQACTSHVHRTRSRETAGQVCNVVIARPVYRAELVVLQGQHPPGILPCWLPGGQQPQKRLVVSVDAGVWQSMKIDSPPPSTPILRSTTHPSMLYPLFMPVQLSRHRCNHVSFT